MKIVHVYGFCNSNDYGIAIEKIYNLCSNLVYINIYCDFSFNNEGHIWFENMNLNLNTPDYIIGVDSDYRKLTSYELEEIRSKNVPYRLIKI